jgi:hypothetical protein
MQQSSFWDIQFGNVKRRNPPPPQEIEYIVGFFDLEIIAQLSETLQKSRAPKREPQKNK